MLHLQKSSQIANWVADSVLNKEDSRRRAAVVKQFISVADVSVLNTDLHLIGTHFRVCSVVVDYTTFLVWLPLSQDSIPLPSVGLSERGSKLVHDI